MDWPSMASREPHLSTARSPEFLCCPDGCYWRCAPFWQCWRSCDYGFELSDPDPAGARHTLPVKVVLAWTDEPSLANEPENFPGVVTDLAHILVNDINLTVEAGSPCNTRYIGNRTTVAVDARGEESVADSTCLSTAYDTTNNVEWIKFFPSVTGATQFTVKVATTQSINQRFALVVYNAYDSSGPAPPAKPLNVVATGNTTPSVNITWSSVSGATSYEVRRRSSNSPFASLAGQPNGPSFADTAVSAGLGYVYSVRARNVTGVSDDSAPDFATTMAFTESCWKGAGRW